MLPINHLGGRPVFGANGQPLPPAPGFRFDQLTLSNLELGSPLYWLHFVFAYCFTFWVMWLLIKYYQARGHHEMEVSEKKSKENNTTPQSSQACGLHTSLSLPVFVGGAPHFMRAISRGHVVAGRRKSRPLSGRARGR